MELIHCNLCATEHKCAINFSTSTMADRHRHTVLVACSILHIFHSDWMSVVFDFFDALRIKIIMTYLTKMSDYHHERIYTNMIAFVLAFGGTREWILYFLSQLVPISLPRQHSWFLAHVFSSFDFFCCVQCALQPSVLHPSKSSEISFTNCFLQCLVLFILNVSFSNLAGNCNRMSIYTLFFFLLLYLSIQSVLQTAE